MKEGNLLYNIICSLWDFDFGNICNPYTLEHGSE